MIVELSYLIGEKETVLIENQPKPQVIPRKRMAQGSPNNTSLFAMHAHTGTHVDAPWHVYPDGKTVVDFAISDFVFDHPFLMDCSKGDFEKITRDDLEHQKDQMAEADILLVLTHFGQHRHHDWRRYVNKSPSFSVDAAQYVADSLDRLRCIGVDCLSVENLEEARNTGYPVHKALLGKGRHFFLIEDMNLEPVVGRTVKRVYAIPLRLVGVEGSPATVFAEIE